MVGCRSDTPVAGANFLIVIADDLGVDKVSAYGESKAAPATPTLDALAREGVLFRNAYAPPACSPSRAAILTGRQPRRFGLGSILRARKESWELPLDELTLPELLALAPADYATSAVGKWHLSTYSSPTGLRHPLASGFGWYAGSVANLMMTREPGRRGTYTSWEKNDNGTLRWSQTYATTDTVDDALARMQSMTSPWLLWVALNAVHTPFHEPPEHLHSRSAPVTQRDRHDASVEAMDTEVGRLLAGMDSATRSATTLIFLGDNGSQSSVSDSGGETKGSLSEAGVRVPLLISGPTVARSGEVDALVHVTDLFPTIAELAGVGAERIVNSAGKPVQLDGMSLVPYLQDLDHPPVREIVYVDRFAPNGAGPRSRDERMIRDERYKLIERVDGESLFFDLSDGGPDGRRVGESATAEEREARRVLEDRLAKKVLEISPSR
jgi:arylsulfatase A-like enzyme